MLPPERLGRRRPPPWSPPSWSHLQGVLLLTLGPRLANRCTSKVSLEAAIADEASLQANRLLEQGHHKLISPLGQYLGQYPVRRNEEASVWPPTWPSPIPRHSHWQLGRPRDLGWHRALLGPSSSRARRS